MAGKNDFKIVFNKNWNGKLTNNIFTTIRYYNDKKMAYYTTKIGETATVLIRDEGKWEYVGRAVLKGCYELNLEELDKDTEKGRLLRTLLMLDTGLTDIEEIKELLGQFGITDKGLLLIFESVTEGCA